MAGRPNQMVEMRLVTEWAQTYYSHAAYQVRARLGSLPVNLGTGELDTEEARLVHNAYARWADLLVFLPEKTLLVEAKIVAHPTAIAQLMIYKRLIPASPFLNLRPDLPIEPVLLYAVADPLVSQIAIEQGLTLAQFHPDWVDEYLATRFARQRSAPLPQAMASS